MTFGFKPPKVSKLTRFRPTESQSYTLPSGINKYTTYIYNIDSSGNLTKSIVLPQDVPPDGVTNIVIGAQTFDFSEQSLSFHFGNTRNPNHGFKEIDGFKYIIVQQVLENGDNGGFHLLKASVSSDVVITTRINNSTSQSIPHLYEANGDIFQIHNFTTTSLGQTINTIGVVEYDKDTAVVTSIDRIFGSSDTAFGLSNTNSIFESGDYLFINYTLASDYPLTIPNTNPYRGTLKFDGNTFERVTNFRLPGGTKDLMNNNDDRISNFRVLYFHNGLTYFLNIDTDCGEIGLWTYDEVTNIFNFIGARDSFTQYVYANGIVYSKAPGVNVNSLGILNVNLAGGPGSIPLPVPGTMSDPGSYNFYPLGTNVVVIASQSISGDNFRIYNSSGTLVYSDNRNSFHGNNGNSQFLTLGSRTLYNFQSGALANPEYIQADSGEISPINVNASATDSVVLEWIE